MALRKLIYAEQVNKGSKAAAKLRKASSFLLALSFCLLPSVSLETDAPVTKASLIQSSDNYRSYLEKHAGTVRHDNEILITPHDAALDEDGRASVAERGGRIVVEAQSGSTVTWRFEAAQEGFYNLEVEFLPGDGTKGSMERNVYIDGQVPFNEARGILLKREFAYSGEKVYNVLGNEILPPKTEVRKWRCMTLTSSCGYITGELKFYLTAGIHTVSLEAVREPSVYGNLRFYCKKDAKDYSQVKQKYMDKGYSTKGLAPLYIKAERPLSVSDTSIYPVADRSSAYTQPSSEKNIALNVIGGSSWATAGQFIRYAVKVEKSGLYCIALRFKQDISKGFCVYRRLTIDGELPFAEASAIKFTFDNAWQLKYLGNGKEDYLFYFEAGRAYELTLEASCGDYADILSELNESLSFLNSIYRSLLMITGPSPDLYRDYNFKGLIPGVIEQMGEQYEQLLHIKQQIIDISETGGVQVTAINNLIIQLEKMHRKPEKYIASSLESFKSNISSLGTWIMSSTSQPLMLDYILINQPGMKLQKGDTGLIGTVFYEFKRFIHSFFNDYNLASAIENDDTDSIEAWIYTGRDQAQIVRDLIDGSFIPQENIAVNLKLVTGGTLLPAILAGKGPDVSLGAASNEPINLAVRKAVLDLTQFPDFEEISKRFHKSALIPFAFDSAVYALPETQNFLMLFYRVDILEQLGLAPPVTWDDLYDIMLELQINNLNVGLPDAYTGLLMFLMQNGGSLYSEDFKDSLLDSDIALASFKQLTDYYALYDFPVQYDFVNRFRSGEMPMAVQLYTAYNQLILFAPEIKGLWKMVPIPGSVDENGNTDNSSIGAVTGTMILNKTEKKESGWRFLKWWSSENIQSEFGMRMESILGESAKYATANMNAISRLSWAYSDLHNLMTQWENVRGIPEVPGGYYSSRYVNFAFNKVISTNANAEETLEYYVPTITSELRRKLKEFGY